MSLLIRPALPQDLPALQELNRRAFRGDAEGKLIRALDAGGHTRVSLVAEDPEIVGHILFSEIEILHANQATKALSLAPMCVHPERQRRGIGSALVREGILRCRTLGYPAIFVLGHPEFYRRFGFRHELTTAFECPYSGPAFLAMELRDGSLRRKKGEIIYSEPFRSEL